jgi:hypothetical protein
LVDHRSTTSTPIEPRQPMALTGLAHSRSILGLAIGRSALLGDPFVRNPAAGTRLMSYWLLAGLCCCLSTRTGIAPIRIGNTPGQPISRAFSSLRQRHIPVLRYVGSVRRRGKDGGEIPTVLYGLTTIRGGKVTCCWLSWRSLKLCHCFGTLVLVANWFLWHCQ